MHWKLVGCLTKLEKAGYPKRIDTNLHKHYQMICRLYLAWYLHCRELDSRLSALLGTLMVVGLLVTLCLLKEPQSLSTLHWGLTGVRSGHRDSWLYTYCILPYLFSLVLVYLFTHKENNEPKYLKSKNLILKRISKRKEVEVKLGVAMCYVLIISNFVNLNWIYKGIWKICIHLW